MRILLLVALLAGCGGSVSVPDTTLARILQQQETIARRQDSCVQASSQLEGKVDALIALKHEELDALRGVRESFERTEQVFGRLLAPRVDDGRLERR